MAGGSQRGSQKANDLQSDEKRERFLEEREKLINESGNKKAASRQVYISCLADMLLIAALSCVRGQDFSNRIAQSRILPSALPRKHLV